MGSLIEHFEEIYIKMDLKRKVGVFFDKIFRHFLSANHFGVATRLNGKEPLYTATVDVTVPPTHVFINKNTHIYGPPMSALFARN